MRRRWRIPAVLAILGVVLGLGLSFLQAPVYRASASLLLEPGRVSPSPVVMDPGEVATQARVVASAPVAERVIRTLGLAERPDQLLQTVTVEVLEDTRMVEITAERSDPQQAADVANAFADAYVDHQEAAARAAAVARRRALAAQLAVVDTRLQRARELLRSPAGGGQPRAVLRDRRESLLAVEADIRSQLAASTTDAVTATVGGQVLLRAERPASPSAPRPVASAAYGGLVGLVLGVLLAYLHDRVDDGIRDERRLRSAAGGRPVLARLSTEDGPRDGLVTLVAPRSPASEGYRTLATNVRFLVSGAPPGSGGTLLVVASAAPREGKSTAAANLAVAAARFGLRVVLVDADLRNPSVATHFGVDPALGLSNVLAGQADLADAVIEGCAVDVPGLAILVAGPPPPNPAELLAGPRAGALWRELRADADLVVVDTAPVLSVADTLEITGGADLTVLVARHRASRARHLATAVEQIQQVGGRVAGVVWCDVPDRAAPQHYQGAY